jgi:hypothetical protein
VTRLRWRIRHDRPVAGATVAPTEELGTTARPIGFVTIVVSAAFVVAGISLPQAAESLFRLLIFAGAMGYVGARAYRIFRPVASANELYSPFDRLAVVPAPKAAPEPVLKLAIDLRSADNPRLAQRKPIPVTALRTIRGEAARRLDHNYGLSIANPLHRNEIRDLVSEPTWLLIHPNEIGAIPGDPPESQPTRVPVSQLGRILDDLEKL